MMAAVIHRLPAATIMEQALCAGSAAGGDGGASEPATREIFFNYHFPLRRDGCKRERGHALVIDDSICSGRTAPRFALLRLI